MPFYYVLPSAGSSSLAMYLNMYTNNFPLFSWLLNKILLVKCDI